VNFRSESELDHFLASFDAGTMPRYCWTHAAHLAMCAARLFEEDSGTVDRIRLGIQHYNHSQGIVTTKTSGYHETLTMFWIASVRGYLHEERPETRLAAVCGAIRKFGLEAALPRKRYTFDVFESTEARVRWIPPDRE
jgi:hypothetical protein